jgi:signal transduction histidine kinase/CheY-like chemotaxis protein
VNIHQQRTILIIDDASHDREMYRRYLNLDYTSAYLILEEESAEAGLAVCRTHVIDGILLDFLLPDANGLEFLAALKAQHGDYCPPVVMITGQGNEAIAANAIKSGADDYLIKRQITPESLRVTVQSAINHAQLRCQLLQSETRFQTSVENMLDCFGIFSAIRAESGEIIDFRVEYLNAAALADQRLSAAALGQSFHDLSPNHCSHGLFAAYCRVVETGQPFTKEALISHDNGPQSPSARAYDIRISKLDDGFVASWRDVTIRQQAERMRQQQMERERIGYHMAEQIRRSLQLENILQTTVTEVQRFLACDRVFIYQFHANLSGQVIVESVVAPALSILTEQQEICFTPALWEQYRLGQIQICSDLARLENGDVHSKCFHQLQVRANLEVPIFQGDVLWGLLVANQCHSPRHWDDLDVELVQHLATQVAIAIDQATLLAQAQTARRMAEEANLAKDELLAMVSHELRSPLTTVLGWAQLLQTRTLDPTLVQQALKSIERSTQTQSQLVEDLLDVSRMMHGTLRLELAPVNLITVVETTIANLCLVAEAKAISLELYVLAAPLIVMGHAHRLQQIVTNLITNAIKCTPEAGKVEIFLEQIKPEAQPDDCSDCPTLELAQLVVRDTGRGIAPDLLPQIFQPFFQAESATALRKDGLGLGLAIVHRLVELHQGMITATSPGVDQGATFTLHLPLL